MKVQEVEVDEGRRYLLLDDNYKVIKEVKKYLKYLSNLGRSPETLRAYAYDLMLLYEYLDIIGIPMLQIASDPEKGPLDILSRFVLWLQYPKAATGLLPIDREECQRTTSSVNRIVTTVTCYYEYLASDGVLPELDLYRKRRINGGNYKGFLYELAHERREEVKNMLKLPAPTKPVKAVTRAHYDQMLGVCSCRRDKLMVAIMYETGVRIGELLGIRYEDVADIGTGELKLIARENINGARVKNHSERSVFLPAYVTRMLTDYMIHDQDDIESDYIFTVLNGKTRGQPLKAATVEAMFARISAKIGYHVTPHMLRHGFATEKLQYGWDKVDIQKYLGHKHIQTTDIYADYDVKQQRKLIGSFFDHADIYSKYYRD